MISIGFNDNIKHLCSVASFFVRHCVYDSFDDYLSFGKQDHIDTSQLNGIFEV